MNIYSTNATLDFTKEVLLLSIRNDIIDLISLNKNRFMYTRGLIHALRVIHTIIVDELHEPTVVALAQNTGEERTNERKTRERKEKQ